MTPNRDSGVRAPFRRILGFDLRTGVALLLVFGLVRATLVLQANVTGSYQLVSIVFVAMIALPWIVLTRVGRRRIGLITPKRARWVPVAVLAGGVMALLTFILVADAFTYIARSYTNVPDDMTSADRLMFFGIYAGISIFFSPIGEELLYRGFAHESFVARLGERGAALIDAAAFALVHVAHFGVVYLAGIWTVLPGPATVWVGAMFASSLVFYAFKRAIGSIVGAIAAHAGFNLAMNAVIFFVVLA